MTFKNPGELHWPALTCGVLIRRYKRFIAEVRLENGEVVTAHCANSGRMTECCEPGRKVYLSFHDSPHRKLKYTWEIIDMPGSLVGVNTRIPNLLVNKSINSGMITELRGYDCVLPEIKVGKSSRIDFLLTGRGKKNCFVEVKNCTLVKDGIAAFPDAVTSRGLKHLSELQGLVSDNNRCVIFFLIQRMDADIFMPADYIDPEFGNQIREACEKGVEVMAYDVVIDLEKIVLNRPVPVDMQTSLLA